MIYGNKEGIRDSLLAQMETLYDLDLSEEVFAPADWEVGIGGKGNLFGLPYGRANERTVFELRVVCLLFHHRKQS